MMSQKQTRPALAATSNRATAKLNTRTGKLSKPQTKINRVFLALASGRSYNRFEAARELHDTCLHSTVSDIQRNYGVQIHRSFEVVPGYQGAPTHVCRYRLVGPELIKARQRLRAAGLLPDLALLEREGGA